MEQLSGNQVILRQLDVSHIQHYLSAFTHEVQQPLHVNDIQEEHAYLLQRLSIKEGNTFFYCIFNYLERLIGALEIRGQEHAGQLYTWLHPDFWGKQYFQEALNLARVAYFQATQSFYFTARVDVVNKRSYRALKKAGFADYGLVEGPYGRQYELVCIKKS